MAQSQYNFKIEDELKEEAELLSKDFESKQEFLAALLDGYRSYKNNVADLTIDMSKYEDIDIKTMSLLNETFKHIIYTMQQNTTSTKQQLLSVNEERELMVDERENFKKQIEALKANCNQEALDIQKLYKLEVEEKDIQIEKNEELQKNHFKLLAETEKKAKDIQVELEQVKLIAKQVETITSENSLFRQEMNEINVASQAIADGTASKLKELAYLLTEEEKKVFKAELEFINLKKTIEASKLEFGNIKTEIRDKNLEIKNLEKENTILSTKLELMMPKEKEVL
jgi:chromosome segregation ATPase